ncbi:hypothetical protein SAMN05920897_10880 [Alkalispirochaeta americana]|uniref:Outer membrane protein beta-barrel domain-containing protein n=1 Tax=Alkalispirochaeta americana TaxID=159291 RepID=A0A1N6SH82_9SPIO|nr:DUF6588 family protein [Alkalispirochaeta americana]SIQ40379.1 hypothetical protein SAMN05920897_10880 [Alkalispirochaeta americana]
MKRKGIAALFAGALVLAAMPVSADTIDDLNVFKGAFEDFSKEFANSLPMNSTIGLNWSDAYIGQILPLPSVGVGITTGFTTIPLKVLEDMVDDLGLDSGSALGDIPSMGIPLPGYAFDARIGGILFPFDVGIKFGTIPDTKIGDVEVGYTNVGVDLRYAVLSGGWVMPKVSVGVGYNYLSGSVKAPMGLGDVDIGNVDYDGAPPDETATVTLKDPDIDFDWEAHVFDVKVQVSKQFFVIEPHLGMGASYGRASTNAGFDGDIEVDGANLDDLKSISGVDIKKDNIGVSKDVTPFSTRIFGGASLNLPFMRFDVSAMYNLTSGAVGGTLGARIQL